MSTGRAGFQPATSSFANIIFVIVEGISKFGIKIRPHPDVFKWGNCSPLLPKLLSAHIFVLVLFLPIV